LEVIVSIEQARLNLPLVRLMQQHGDDVKMGSIICPFCKKKSATLREVKGRQWFKCFNPSCESRTSEKRGTWDEVGYLGYKLSLNRKEAFTAYLKTAGVWREWHNARLRLLTDEVNMKLERAVDPEKGFCQVAVGPARKGT
jgi:hypothetical protein